MKQNLLIILVIGFLIVVLAALNAATYVQKEKVADTEFAPNRSTYNAGSTGAQAFYTLLSETGRNVTRWQSSFETLTSDMKNRPSVLVLIGPLRGELTDAESMQLMKWVSAGGTLILIDREPSRELAMTTANWQLSVLPEGDTELFGVDAADQKQMTASTPAQKPAVLSYFSKGVNAVQPSRFASSIMLDRFDDANRDIGRGVTYSAPVEDRSLERSSPSPTPYDFYSADQPPPPPPARQDREQVAASDT